MPDPHDRRTGRNARSANDFVTRREVVQATQRLLKQDRQSVMLAVNATAGDWMAAHVARYHTPWYVRAWRWITRRGDA